MSEDSSLELSIGLNHQLEIISIRGGSLIYNGKETNLKVGKSRPFVIVFKFIKEETGADTKINASLKLYGKVEIGKVKVFEETRKLNRFLSTLLENQ